jgi:GTPase SAR1 family protein
MDDHWSGDGDAVEFKVVLAGDADVGKSAFLQRFADCHFTTDAVNTVGLDMRFKTFKVSGKTVKLEVRRNIECSL